MERSASRPVVLPFSPHPIPSFLWAIALLLALHPHGNRLTSTTGFLVGLLQGRLFCGQSCPEVEWNASQDAHYYRGCVSKSLDNHLAGMSVFNYLFDKYLLYTHYIPGIVLSTAETKINKSCGSKTSAGILGWRYS